MLSNAMCMRGVGDRLSMTCAGTLPTDTLLTHRIEVSDIFMDPLAHPVTIHLPLRLLSNAKRYVPVEGEIARTYRPTFPISTLQGLSPSATELPNVAE